LSGEGHSVANYEEDIYKYQPLWENWLIEIPIGKGSFGSVYKVYREELGHKYTSAVKIISIPSEDQYKEAEASFGGDEASLSGYFEDIVHNIVNEINMLYTLSGNSNIVGYQDHKVVKKEDRVGWDILIRMEYVTPLKKYCASNTMTEEQVTQLGIDICTALQLCSKKGIIHRDIKDDNIFVNEDGVFKLGDFGISKELSKSGRAASMRGTPLYMAPEIYRGEKYDAVVDIYSLGIVLYKLLNNNRMPFMPPYPETIRFKDSEVALEKRMAGETLRMPVSASEELGEVILIACAHQAKDRYQTAEAMKWNLQKVLVQLKDSDQKDITHNIINPMNSNINQKECHQLQKAPIVFNNESSSTSVISDMNGNNLLDNLNQTASIFASDELQHGQKEYEPMKDNGVQGDMVDNGTISIFSSHYEPKSKMATSLQDTPLIKENYPEEKGFEFPTFDLISDKPTKTTPNVKIVMGLVVAIVFIMLIVFFQNVQNNSITTSEKESEQFESINRIEANESENKILLDEQSDKKVNNVNSNTKSTDVQNNDIQSNIEVNDVQNNVQGKDVQSNVKVNSVQSNVQVNDVQSNVQTIDVQNDVQINDVQSDVYGNSVQSDVYGNSVQSDVYGN